MKDRIGSTMRRMQCGQAMTEYTIVLAFGVMVLVGPGTDVIAAFVDVFKWKHQSYAYAVSLSEIPDSPVTPLPASVQNALNQLNTFTTFPTTQQLTGQLTNAAIGQVTNALPTNAGGIINTAIQGLTGLPTIP